ncbi:MAG: hypothetical protein LBU60_04045, partial [Clostridiales bacterium]|nr:hypothetical protein [Clostridiales bacterium]
EFVFTTNQKSFACLVILKGDIKIDSQKFEVGSTLFCAANAQYRIFGNAKIIVIKVDKYNNI